MVVETTQPDFKLPDRILNGEQKLKEIDIIESSIPDTS